MLDEPGGVNVSRDGKRWRRGLRACLLALLTAGLLQGCGGALMKRVSSVELQRAALAAAKDPNTWVPAMGAAVFAVSDWDRQLSDWARREQPLFGSRADALGGSDVLLAISIGGALGTSLLVPDEGQAPARPGVQLAALAGTGAATYALKYSVGRPRPDASDELSFPSGHSSFAFSGATLTRRNLAQLDLSSPLHTALDAGTIGLAAAAAWARVEAGVHYPSDVLAGAALGNFVAAMVNDAWLREGGLGEADARVSLLPLQGGALLRVTRYF